jgi:hypothetical protein
VRMTIIPPVPRSQFFTLLGTIIGGFIAVIATLIGVVYWGIDARLKSLEDHFQSAIVASADVKALLTQSPMLEQKITESHDAIIRLQDGQAQLIKLQENQAQILKDQFALFQTIQDDQQKTRIQMDNIQRQVHSIPGVTK